MFERRIGQGQQRPRQEELWVATASLPRPASHPFYERLNRLLEDCHFDEFVESVCEPFYAKTLGRPGLAPGIYFRLLLVGYFEGIDRERGRAWRAADSLGVRAFLGIALDEARPRSFDDLADEAIDRRRNASAGIGVAAGDSGRAWIAAGPKDRD
jgi:transposase